MSVEATRNTRIKAGAGLKTETGSGRTIFHHTLSLIATSAAGYDELKGMSRGPILLVHGGAGAGRIRGRRYEEYSESLSRIMSLAYPLLAKGRSALEVVIRAAELLEDDPLYNAGKGSKIQSDGHIRMSASLMDGKRKRFAGCVNVERVKNPIRLAEALMNREDRVLAGKGAERLARELGLPFASPFTGRCREDYVKRKAGWTGTIGAVALDRQGRLAAATSTGGRGFEFPHRVSDTPTSAGNFATSHCAVSATGVGEEIVDFALASTLCAYVEAGLDFKKAARQLLSQAQTAKARFGFIALDRNGQDLMLTTTKSLIWAKATPGKVEIFPCSK